MRVMSRILLTTCLSLCMLPGPLLAQEVATISQIELLQKMSAPTAALLIVDVRTAEEFNAGHLQGAINISHDQLANKLTDLLNYQQREVVVYCRTGRRSDIAARLLQAAGFKQVKHLAGDFTAWQAAERPIVTP